MSQCCKTTDVVTIETIDHCWQCGRSSDGATWIDAVIQRAEAAGLERAAKVASDVADEVARHEHPYIKRDGFFAALGIAEDITCRIRALLGGKGEA